MHRLEHDIEYSVRPGMGARHLLPCGRFSEPNDARRALSMDGSVHLCDSREHPGEASSLEAGSCGARGRLRTPPGGTRQDLAVTQYPSNSPA